MIKFTWPIMFAYNLSDRSWLYLAVKEYGCFDQMISDEGTVEEQLRVTESPGFTDFVDDIVKFCLQPASKQQYSYLQFAPRRSNPAAGKVHTKIEEAQDEDVLKTVRYSGLHTTQTWSHTSTNVLSHCNFTEFRNNIEYYHKTQYYPTVYSRNKLKTACTLYRACGATNVQ